MDNRLITYTFFSVAPGGDLTKIETRQFYMDEYAIEHARSLINSECPEVRIYRAVATVNHHSVQEHP